MLWILSFFTKPTKTLSNTIVKYSLKFNLFLSYGKFCSLADKDKTTKVAVLCNSKFFLVVLKEAFLKLTVNRTMLINYKSGIKRRDCPSV